MVSRFSGFNGFAKNMIYRKLIFEKQRRKFAEASPPGQEFVSGVRRHIGGVLDTGAVESLVVRADAGGVLTAATTAKHDFDFLPETGRAVDIIGSDGAATEETDVGELVEILQCYELGLHSAHRQAGHSTMGLIGESAEV